MSRVKRPQNLPQYLPDLPQPYEGLDKARDLSHLSSSISYKHKEVIKSVCPQGGTLNHTAQILFSAVAENLIEQQMDYYSPEHEKYYVRLLQATRKFISEFRDSTRCSTSEPPKPTTPRAKRGGVKKSNNRTEGS